MCHDRATKKQHSARLIKSKTSKREKGKGDEKEDFLKS